MQKEIVERLEATGLKARVVSALHLPELEEDIRGLCLSGAVGGEVKSMLEKRFRFELPGDRNMQSIFVLARPSPIGQAVFQHGGRAISAAIPPTYQDYYDIPRQIENELNGMLSSLGYCAKYAGGLPEKLLAARSGLVKYGRNNITYAEGMGSFAYLSAYFTDMPCEEDSWGEAQRMPACEKCTICLKGCPTGAIGADRRVISAERCLTWHNEADSSVPFPGWINAEAHNSLIGCMACQLACPANKHVLGFQAEPVEFDEEETAFLLAETALENLPQKTRDKLEIFNIAQYYKPVARNLRALFKREAL